MDQESSTDTMGLISVITGVLALLFAILQFMCVPFVGMLAPPLALVSIITGAIGVNQGGNNSLSKAGLGAGCAAGVIEVLFFGCMFTAFGAYFVAIFAAILAGEM